MRSMTRRNFVTLAPAAHVGQGLSIYYSGGAEMPGQVEDWIDSQKPQG